MLAPEATNAITATATSQPGMTFLGVELSRAAFIAEIALVLSGILVAVLTALVFHLNGRLKSAEAADRARFETEARSAIVHAEARAAEANERTAQAELQLEELRIKSWPRSATFDTDAFVAELKGKPRVNVTLWYLPGNDEAYGLAMNIAGGLHLAGWTPAYLPAPIPPTAAQIAFKDLSPEKLAAMPPLQRVGAQATGVSLLGRTLPWGPLQRAVMEATRFSGQTTSTADASIPEGEIRIVVGAKP